MNCRKMVAATAVSFALITGQVSAGGFAEPVMEAEVIEEQASRSGGYIVPLLLIAILIAAASGGGSTPSPS